MDYRLSRFHAWAYIIETTRISWSSVEVNSEPQHGPIKSMAHRLCSYLSTTTLTKHAHLPTLWTGSGIKRFANFRTLNLRFTDMDSRCLYQYMYLTGELGYTRHSSISSMKFLQCAFNLSDDELQELKKSIEDVPVHISDGYSTFREEFERRAKLFQPDAKLPFSRMANMILPYPHNLESIWHRLRMVDINREAPSSSSSS